MASGTEDLDNFTNALSADLGLDTVVLLSSKDDDRRFIGAEALVLFAGSLLGAFALAFFNGLKGELERQAKEGGVKLAQIFTDRVKRAATGLTKPAPADDAERKAELATVDEALRLAASLSEIAGMLEEAESKGHARLVADLKAIDMPDDEAQRTAERLIKTIQSRMRSK